MCAYSTIHGVNFEISIIRMIGSCGCTLCTNDNKLNNSFVSNDTVAASRVTS